MSPNQQPQQLALPLATPGHPSNESYLAVMYAARSLGRDPALQQVFLDRAITQGEIVRSDAQCIWRGVMRHWRTPFD